jgi:hypothetical protein
MVDKRKTIWAPANRIACRFYLRNEALGRCGTSFGVPFNRPFIFKLGGRMND